MPKKREGLHFRSGVESFSVLETREDIKKGEATSLQLPFMEIAYCPFVSKE